MKKDIGIAAFALLATSLGASPASALVVKTWDGDGTPTSVNTSAPADDPGWSNLSSKPPAGEFHPPGIYLGDQWVITASHAGGGNFRMGGGVFPRITGTSVVLTNPIGFDGRTLDSRADLTLYRIGVDTTTGLTPEELDPKIRRLTIADSLPSSSDVLTMFGRGAQRIVDGDDPNGQFHWNSNGTETSNQFAAEHGFKVDGSRTYRWGANTISSPAPVTNVREGNQMLIDFPNGRDTIGFVTRFDRGLTDAGNPIADGSTPDEAQGTFGDSGGPVFWKDDGEWVLAGVMHAIYQSNVQMNPSNDLLLTAWFGNHTAISDLSLPHYRDQIEDIRSTVMYSYAGDIDLDGSATGEIVGGSATGDLAVLVDNWLATFPTAGRESWIAGDLNQDAIVDLSDFVLLRDALGGQIEASTLSALIQAAALPEPVSLVLLLSLASATTVLPRR